MGGSDPTPSPGAQKRKKEKKEKKKKEENSPRPPCKTCLPRAPCTHAPIPSHMASRQLKAACLLPTVKGEGRAGSEGATSPN